MARKFLIWSFEHEAWWMPARYGYTNVIRDAGLYDLEEACRICQRANIAMDNGVPNEAMVPVDPDEFLSEKRKALDNLSRQMAEVGVDELP